MHAATEPLHGLKRHFLTSLREASPIWLSPDDGPHLGFSGDGVLEGTMAGTVSFGQIKIRGEHRRRVTVENLGQQDLRITAETTDSWLRVRWERGKNPVWLERANTATLDFIFHYEGREELTYRGGVRLLAESASGLDEMFELHVVVGTFLDGPRGLFSFNGLPEQAPYNFGNIEPLQEQGTSHSYTLSVRPQNSQPLQVMIKELPPWLSVGGDLHLRGPRSGLFFVQDAPVTLHFRPIRNCELLGLRQARISFNTNDARPAFQHGVIELEACFEISAPHLTALTPKPLRAARPATIPLKIELTNWGSVPAELLVDKNEHIEFFGPLTTIVAARPGRPGRAILEAGVHTGSLLPGTHHLELALRVEGGQPERLILPVKVVVVNVEATPSQIDFGKVPRGEVRQRKIQFWASDGSFLFLKARPLPPLEGFLTATFEGQGVVDLDCLIPVGSRQQRFVGPGLEIVEERLQFSRQVKIRLHPGLSRRQRNYRLAAFLVLALSLGVGLTLIFWQWVEPW